MITGVMISSLKEKYKFLEQKCKIILDILPPEDVKNNLSASDFYRTWSLRFVQ